MNKSISLIEPKPPAMKATNQGEMPLESTLSTPWVFLRPTASLHAAVVNPTKRFLDCLASSVGDSQLARQRVNRKRKRSDIEQESLRHTLQLKELYVQGFVADQIWEQATRILDSAEQEIENDFALTAENAQQAAPERETSALQFRKKDSGDTSLHIETLISSEPSADDSNDEDDYDSDMESVSISRDTPGDYSRKQMGSEKGIESDDSSQESESQGSSHETYVQDPFGLNDGFFSIDEFNKQTEFLERQDAKGGADDDADSDEEGIDWHENPLAVDSAVSHSVKKPETRTSEDGNESNDSEEEGPTFDNVNLQSDSDMEDADAYASGVDATNWMNTSDIKYSDFFAPPPRKATKKKARFLPKTQPHEAIGEVDIDRAMADVRRDLFEDDASMHESDASDNDVAEPKLRHSAHEKQRARIADEIRRLEAANVAKKEWMLAGEARGAERPMNSLIEEDLDFERIGKPVPVVTAELSEDIEELVKRRILAKEFDEVIRRRPGAADGRSAKKGRFELEDTKPQQSLADLFETDHLRATDPNYVDPKNQKLIREHTEISNLWKEISDRLDTLSNWHYKPKAPQATINVITDVATIMMEDAQPTTSGVASLAALAPQEIYTPGDDGKVVGEVVLKNGESIAKDEMTREEKLKLRRKHKNQRKAHVDHSKQQSGKADEKQQIVSALKKGGVKVIGKQGDLMDIHGSKNREGSAKTGADMLKL